MFLIKCTISRLGYEDKINVVVQDYWNSSILGNISGLADLVPRITMDIINFNEVLV